MSQTAEIIIQYVNPPRGNGPGNIKDADGNYWQVWPDKLELFEGQEGQAFLVTYQTKTYQGKRQDTIVSAVPMDGAPQPPIRRTPMRPPVRPSGPVRRPIPNGRAPQQFNDERSEDISVLALVKGWMDKIPVGDVASAVHALRSCREAWRQYKRGGPETESFPGDEPMPEGSEHEFDDKIPY